MSYDVYLGQDRFPVTPSKISLKYPGKNKTLFLLNEGEINLLKLPGLTEISCEFLLPARENIYSWAFYPDGFRPPEYYIDLLDRLKKAQELRDRLRQLIILRAFTDGSPQANTNIRVSVEDFEVDQSHEDGFDFILKAKFLQYSNFEKNTVEITNDYELVLTKNRETFGKPNPAAIELSPGETLHGVAAKYLGGAQDFKKIAEKNGISNPFHIQIGSRLILV